MFKYEFDKILENRIRLGIMSMLMLDDWVDFNTLKNALKLTDGNLASHINTLEKNNYILIHKEFEGKKTKTSYVATPKGKKAFEKYLDEMENFIQFHQ